MLEIFQFIAICLASFSFGFSLSNFLNQRIHRSADKIINRQKAEIERYKDMVAQNEGVLPEYENLVKAEAIKEFAAKIKEDAEWICDDSYIEDALTEYIDNLVKETVGEQPPLNDVKCKDCEYLELELPYAVCSKAYMGIVQPNDSCGKGKPKEMVGDV